MGEGVTINKDSYITLINKDIQALDKYFPEHSLEKRHIKMILEWSIDKEFPEDIWDKRNEPSPDKRPINNICNSGLPNGFLFNEAGRVVLDPRVIPNIDDD